MRPTPSISSTSTARPRWSRVGTPSKNTVFVTVQPDGEVRAECESAHGVVRIDGLEPGRAYDLTIEADDATSPEADAFLPERFERRRFVGQNARLDDPLFDELGSDGSEYGVTERPALEDDRFGYG